MKRAACVLIAICLLGFARPAQGAVIGYEAIDLTDLLPGEDLWQYRYFVDEATFAANQGFSVYFDVGLYSSLQSALVSPDWDVLTVQPDSALPDGGLYDALALVPDASIADPFVVSFVWLGGAGAPGPQRWTLNQWDDAGIGFVGYLGAGQTAAFTEPAPVPEPSTLLLVSTASAGLMLKMRRRRQSRCR
jgi:hypothetical protein